MRTKEKPKNNNIKTLIAVISCISMIYLYAHVEAYEVDNRYCILDAYPYVYSANHIEYISVRKYIDGTVEEGTFTKEQFYRYPWLECGCDGKRTIIFNQKETKIRLKW